MKKQMYILTKKDSKVKKSDKLEQKNEPMIIDKSTNVHIGENKSKKRKNGYLEQRKKNRINRKRKIINDELKNLSEKFTPNLNANVRKHNENKNIETVDEDVQIIKHEITTKRNQVLKNLIQKKKRPLTRNVEMLCLNGVNWLDDRAIDLAQDLMKQQFPDVDGLQSTIVLSTGCVYTPSCSRFVQIYNFSGNHWLTLTKRENETNCTTIYDSLGININEDVKSICTPLLHSKEKTYKLEIKECHQQNGLNDCGLFAIANTLAFCAGEDPTTFIWDQSKMIDHLRQCFSHGHMDIFPIVRRKKPGSTKFVEQVNIYCFCRQPGNTRTMWKCSMCHEWYHSSCHGAPRRSGCLGCYN